jgi:hypothetical protein
MHTTEMPRRLLLASEVLQMVEQGILAGDLIELPGLGRRIPVSDVLGRELPL